MKTLKKALNKLHTPKWLAVVLLVVLILRIPSFFEPYYYGDEMIYLALGEGIRQGVPLYSGIHDNKPPFLYITAAVAGSLFWFKVILALWSLATIYLFWRLTVALFPKGKKLQKISTVVFALLTTIPLLEGNIANAELFMIGPTIAAFLILLNKKLSFKNLFISGMLFSTAALFKVPAAFDIPAIILLWLVSYKRLTKKRLKDIAKNTAVLAAGFLAPIALTFVWYFLRGAFSQYLIAAFLQNVGYLSSFRPGDVREPFLVRNAPLLQRAGVVFIGLIILYWKRKNLSKKFIFLTSWVLLGLFAVTLSERPYPHYLIQVVPPISILLGIFFTRKNIEQVLALIPLGLVVFVPVYFNFWYYPTGSYYQRFINLSTGKITQEQYLNSFGQHIERNYKIAEAITSSTRREDKVFIWGDSSMIYALSRRLPPIKYVADYHINDFSDKDEVLQSLRADMPALVVVLPESEPFPRLNGFLRNNYGLVEQIGGVEIWKLLGQDVRSLIAP